VDASLHDVTAVPGAYDRSVRTRRIAFGYEPLPKHFVDGDIVMSHVMAILSATFPKGEQFFIDSVRNYRQDIGDAELRQQVAGFIGQETMHGREHDRLNHLLQDLGYPTKFVDRATGLVLGAIHRRAPKSVQLAFTAAAEHFTSVLAEQLLADDPFEEQRVPEELRALFRWHALEECEHKSVAYDVYREQVGSEAIRLLVMDVTTAVLVAVAAASIASCVLTDRSARNPLRFAASLLNLRNSPFARKAILLRIAEYHRPGFHPDDRDTEQLVARWRAELFGDEGALRDRLARSAELA
jgi:predicted metal-dependent hydrolase